MVFWDSFYSSRLNILSSVHFAMVCLFYETQMLKKLKLNGTFSYLPEKNITKF